MDKIKLRVKRLKDFFREIDNEQYHINIGYQRSTKVWSPTHKKEFIKDLFKNIFVGIFLFDKRGKKWDIIDGQQRYNTLREFLEGNLKVELEGLPSIGYSDLEKGGIEVEGEKYI